MVTYLICFDAIGLELLNGFANGLFFLQLYDISTKFLFPMIQVKGIAITKSSGRVDEMYLKVALLVLLVLGTTVRAQDQIREPVSFIVTITNMAGIGRYKNSGVTQTPLDSDTNGYALPGDRFEFTVQAAPGYVLSFATMLAQSNDLFFAPDVAGVALYNADGSPVNGDITDLVGLWDAGTEVNQPIGKGDQQALRQLMPNSGDAEHGIVRRVDGMSGYPSVSDILRISLSSDDNGTFIVHIDNVSDGYTIPTPITPLVWVIAPAVEPVTDNGDTARDGVFFTPGMPDRGYGLEALAEDGDSTGLVMVLAGSGMVVPLMPVVWAVHSDEPGSSVFFTSGEPDRGEGLEALAEDGSLLALGTFLESTDYPEWGVASIPDMEAGSGALIPGNFYTITFEATPGQSLSFVTQFVESNDLFLAPDPTGIPLFDADGHPVNGEFTRYIRFWDAGTEVNEAPGVGSNQMLRQAAPDTGKDEIGTVRPVSDAFTYPPVASLIRITIQGYET